MDVRRKERTDVRSFTPETQSDCVKTLMANVPRMMGMPNALACLDDPRTENPCLTSGSKSKNVGRLRIC